MSFLSLPSLPSDESLDTDVCIVGAGAAGISLALRLEKHGIRSVVLERGSEAGNGFVQLAGETSGATFAGIDAGRATGLGGTTQLWAGQCIRLGSSDFVDRPYVALSGWPVSYQEIEPYYAQAETFLGVSHPDQPPRRWKRAFARLPRFDPDMVLIVNTTFCPEPNFARRFRSDLRASSTVSIVFDAPLTTLAPSDDGASIQSAVAQGANSGRISVRAKHYVLACGGIENATILMNQYRRKMTRFNRHVGLYFQDHPSSERVAELFSRNMSRLQRAFSILHDRSGQKFWPKIALSAQAQQAAEILNANAHLAFDYGEGSAALALKSILKALKSRDAVHSDRAVSEALQAPSRITDLLSWFQVRDVLRSTPVIVREALRLAVTGQAPVFRPTSTWLQVHCEQAPSKASRIELSSSKDALGLHIPRVEWRIGELEAKTLRRSTGIFLNELLRVGLIDGFTLSPGLEEGSETPIRLCDSYHHAGTTTMSRTPSSGVVDRDCRVFEYGNLYCAGSSVFPTSGYANPTLTIVALAMRLADHLKCQVRNTAIGNL